MFQVSQCGRGRTKKVEVRIFTLPKPNYDAATLDKAIDWNTAQITEPSIWKDLTDDIKSSVDEPFSRNIQFVKQMIKVIMKKACCAGSPSLHDRITQASTISQKWMPKCKTKSDFPTLE